jgi:hypothetical protein
LRREKWEGEEVGGLRRVSRLENWGKLESEEEGRVEGD